jgi:hypothetical protein
VAAARKSPSVHVVGVARGRLRNVIGGVAKRSGLARHWVGAAARSTVAAGRASSGGLDVGAASTSWAWSIWAMQSSPVSALVLLPTASVRAPGLVDASSSTWCVDLVS